jgi:hypothetical protein
MKRHFGQSLAYALAMFCYAAAIATAVAAFFYGSNRPSDPVHASLIAAVVFFLGCGVVLHVIGTARLKGLLSDRRHLEDD